LAALREQADALDERGRQLARRWSHTSERAAAMRELLELLGRSAILVERSQATGDEDGGGRPSPALIELERRMRALGAETPELWRFELSGDYDALRAALAACVQLEHFELPVTLALRPGEPPSPAGELSLTLWFWI
jgi:hypothetical protein